ncbi:hypothetical protein N2152v2_002137 [Parachlorella kessleri]
MQPTTCISTGRTLRPTLNRLQRSALANPPPLRPAIAARLFLPHPLVGSVDRKHLWCKASRASRGATEYSFPPPAPSDDETPIDANYVPKGALLSTKLPADVRKRAEDAIAKRGYSVTVGDVAAAAGLTLRQAEDALKALAADTLATLQVSSEGEILYAFQPGFQQGLQGRSLLRRIEPAAAAAAKAVGYLARVAFGTALIASVATVYLAIMVAMSSGRDDSNNRGGRQQYYGGGGGARLYFNLSDLLWYWDPFYYRHRRQRVVTQGGQMNFLEAIFSFVFGDGDPNADFDRKRWQAVGRYIESRGGVVAAEELAPFLDVTPGQVASDRDSLAVNESYMVPVLARLGGEPEVDPAGNLLYRFPSLQQTGTASAAAVAPPSPAALEQPWKLTEASVGQQIGVVALGVANLVGVLALGSLLQNPRAAYSLAVNGMSWVMGAMPLLQAYAFSFFLVPAWRWVQNRVQNSAIEARNKARLEAAALVKAPDATLAAKLRSAVQQAKRRILTGRDAVYRTDRDLGSQKHDVEGELFEERLERRERERQRAQQAQQRQQQQRTGWW